MGEKNKNCKLVSRNVHSSILTFNVVKFILIKIKIKFFTFKRCRIKYQNINIVCKIHGGFEVSYSP